MILVGINCIWDGSVHFIQLLSGHVVSVNGIAAYAAAISGVTMSCESLINRILGKRLGSSSLLAVARDYLSDAFTSFGTMIAIIGVVFFDAHWIDPIMANLLGGFIIFNGGQIVSSSASKLSNGFDPEYRKLIALEFMKYPAVKRSIFVDSRYSGNNIIIEAMIEIDGKTNTVDSYRLCRQIETDIQNKYAVLYCCIEVKPYRNDN